MSPLTRSLLAIGALIAAANAHVWEMENLKPGCAGFLISNRRYDGSPLEDIKFNLHPAANEPLINIPDYCANNGVEIQYQRVEVCNNYKLMATSSRNPPRVQWMREDTLSPVYASCEGAPECGPLVIHVSQRCVRDLFLRTN